MDRLPFTVTKMKVLRLYVCQVCLKTFNSRTVLAKHKRVHNEDMRFKCQQCCKVFKFKSLRKQHMKSHIGKAFTCSDCSRSFCTAEKLESHVILVHVVEKKFECEICGRRFSENYTLTRHMKVHSDTKEYTCHICGNGYKWKHVLYNHLKIHERNNTKSMQTSDECLDAATKTSSELQTAQEILSCDVCGESFNDKVLLNSHIDRHMEEKLFNCQICSSRFTGLFLLNHHMKVHNADKPYVCPHCGEGHESKSSLRTHWLLVHASTTMRKETDQPEKRLSTGATAECEALLTSQEVDRAASSINGATDLQDGTQGEDESKVCGTNDSTVEDDTVGALQVQDKGLDDGNASVGDELPADTKSTIDDNLLDDANASVGEALEFCEMGESSDWKTDRPLQEEKDFDPEPRRGRYLKVVCKKLPLRSHYELTQRVSNFSQAAKTAMLGKKKMAREQKRSAKEQKKLLSCDVCGKTFISKAHHRRHIRVHTGETPFACGFCGRTFKWLSSYKCHLVSHGKKSYPCNLCDYTFTSLLSYKLHRQKHKFPEVHYSGGAQCIDPYIASDNEDVEDTGRPLQVNGGIDFEQKVVEHLEAVEDSMSQQDFLVLGQDEEINSSVSSKSALPGEKIFNCDICGKTFASKGHCVRHRRIHTNEMPFSCDLCDQKFKWHSSLTWHLRSHTIPSYRCDVCDTTFTSLSEYMQHKQAHDLKSHVAVGKEELSSSPYECTQYDHAFNSVEQLEEHSQMHAEQVPSDQNGVALATEEDKSFMCLQCGKLYASEMMLLSHVSLHDDVKKYNCYECGITLLDPMSLEAHMKHHEIDVYHLQRPQWVVTKTSLSAT